jgi:cytidine deaminase
LAASDESRLSVLIVNVHPGSEEEFLALAGRLKATLERREFCAQAQTIRDESVRSCFYLVWQWASASAARQSDADSEVRRLTDDLRRVGLVTQAISGARVLEAGESTDRGALIEGDRRRVDRRVTSSGTKGEGPGEIGRQSGPPGRREQTTDLVGAARRARHHAEARFSRFKVGAALETAEGSVVTGCNIENATYGLTICAERVAMFKALSEGHRGFARIAIVADTESPTPPCGACRQILWEFGGNLEIRLASLTSETGTYQLKDLLPLPFDARLLKP